MLSGLANGQQCSELAYNFMARGGGEVLVGSSLSVSSTSGPSISWIAIFSLLDSWAFSTSNPQSHPQPQPSGLVHLNDNEHQSHISLPSSQPPMVSSMKTSMSILHLLKGVQVAEARSIMMESIHSKTYSPHRYFHQRPCPTRLPL